MHRRINVTLPQETLEMLDRLTPRGHRSRLIDAALRHYVRAVGRARLRKRLKDGALRRASRDLRLVEEWFPLEEEAWSREKP